jgi:DNA-binding response OmpR family regulator
MLLKKIVVAEDDDAIAHMVTMALGDAGYLCIRARDGAEALQITRMHQPDLLVLDVMMPRLDGREVATKLKEDVLLSKIPILMLTAQGDVDSRVKGLDAGADDYMPKPFDLRELAARIRALIRSNQRERDRNGTTDLPGSAGIDQHIAGILSGGEGSDVIQIGVIGFDGLVAATGQSESVNFVKSIANFFLSELRAQLGAQEGFLGHLGGADFVASCPADKTKPLLEAILSGFDANRESWSGDAASELFLVAGVVPTEGLSDDAVLAERLSAATAESRSVSRSNYVIFTQKS